MDSIMSSNFQSLPIEIIRLIFDHFCEPYDSNSATFNQGFPTPSGPLGQDALSSLCLVCKSFQHVAQALLYRRFLPRRSEKELDESPDIVLEKWNSQLGSFLRTIKERRDLAALVRSVTCNAFYVNLSQVKALTHPWKTISCIANELPNLEQYSLDVRARSLPYWSSHVQGLIGCLSEDIFKYFFNLLKYVDYGEIDQAARIPILDMKMLDANHFTPSSDRYLSIEPPLSPKLLVGTLRIVDS